MPCTHHACQFDINFVTYDIDGMFGFFADLEFTKTILKKCRVLLNVTQSYSVYADLVSGKTLDSDANYVLIHNTFLTMRPILTPELTALARKLWH